MTLQQTTNTYLARYAPKLLVKYWFVPRWSNALDKVRKTERRLQQAGCSQDKPLLGHVTQQRADLEHYVAVGGQRMDR